MPPRLSESGPTEVADLAHAFNQMAHDLQQLDADRALILAGVSHDLRTPLARLRLGIEMCGADPADVDAMGSDIEDMDRIIDQFLEFSKKDGGEQLEALDLAALADELADAVRPARLHHRSADHRGAALALARPQALRRALTNLIENAIHYAGQAPELEVGSPAGKAAPSTSSTAAPAFRRRGRAGQGPFTRLESARSNTKGSGLGLAIVDRSVRGQNGEFRLAARTGGGLDACIELPAAPKA